MRASLVDHPLGTRATTQVSLRLTQHIILKPYGIGFVDRLTYTLFDTHFHSMCDF